MQNLALRRIIGAFKTTLTKVLQKETGMPPYKHRLKYMAARKAARLFFELNKTNPVRQHLKTPIAGSFINKPTLLCENTVWVMERFQELTGTLEPDPGNDTRLQHKKTIVALQVKAVYQWYYEYIFKKNGKWYRDLTPRTRCVDEMDQLVTSTVLKNCNRKTLSRITQLWTGHSYFREWYQKWGIEKGSYDCRCGKLETVRHILVECPLLETKRQRLKQVSPETDLPTLLNSVTVLQEIVKFVDTERD